MIFHEELLCIINSLQIKLCKSPHFLGILWNFSFHSSIHRIVRTKENSERRNFFMLQVLTIRRNMICLLSTWFTKNVKQGLFPNLCTNPRPRNHDGFPEKSSAWILNKAFFVIYKSFRNVQKSCRNRHLLRNVKEVVDMVKVWLTFQIHSGYIEYTIRL